MKKNTINHIGTVCTDIYERWGITKTTSAIGLFLSLGSIGFVLVANFFQTNL